MVYSPKDDILTVTKLSAASRQVAAAIEALERGDFDVTITLAGAAEGMLPEIASQPLFSTIRDNPNVPPDLTKKDWVSILNADRDWLKHPTATMGEQIDLHIEVAVFMVLRALAKLPEWTPRMWEFKNWASEHGFLSPKPLFPPRTI